MPELNEVLPWVRVGSELFTRALAALDDAGVTQKSDIVDQVRDRLWSYATSFGAAERPDDAEPRADVSAATAALLEQLRQRTTQADWADTVEIDGAAVASADAMWPLVQQLMLGAVDLGTVSFDELPRGFLGALIDEITRQRATDGSPALEILVQDTGEAWRIDGSGEPLRVMAPLVSVAAWLSSRPEPETKVKVLGPGALPELPRWA